MVESTLVNHPDWDGSDEGALTGGGGWDCGPGDGGAEKAWFRGTLGTMTSSAEKR